MRYQFPENLVIDEVRDAIATHNAEIGVPAFIEADRGDHVIFNYVVQFDDAFPEPFTGDPVVDRRRAVLRECRGLTFHKDGRILARKFHKFFGLDAKPETQSHGIDWTRDHLVLDKLDGSLITPILIDGSIRMATKMGFTEIAAYADAFAAENENVLSFSREQIEAGHTLMFEFCSRKNKVVIDHPIDRLILTAIRDNQTGLYLSHDLMRDAADRWGVEVVGVHSKGIHDIAGFLEDVRTLRGAEGYVIRFEDGHMCKVKAEEYLRIHGVKDSLSFEKDVLAMIYGETIDDVKPLLDEDDRRALDAFERDLEHQIDLTAMWLTDVVRQAKQDNPDKKRFATNFVSQWPDPMTKGFLFSIFDGRDAKTVVRNHLAKKCNSATQVEEVRRLVGGLRWFDYYRHGGEV